MPGDGRVRHEVPELAAVRAGRVEAEERPALAGLLEVHAMRLSAEGEAEVAADDRLEIGHRGSASRPRAARRGEDVLDVAEVRHEGPEVALDPGHAELLHREEVVIAGLG